MALKKKFLHTRLESIDLSKTTIVIGILIGLLYAFSFYAFFNVSREVFRMVTINENYDLFVYSESEVKWSNLFFAFISVIIGQSFALTYWFDRPKSFFRRDIPRKRSIIHDQRVLNWVFLSWYSRMATVFGFFYVAFFIENYYILVLSIIVLYLQTWNSIRLTFKGNSLRWMFLSFVILSILSFSISKINIVDYKTLNEAVLKNNIKHKHSIQLPTIEHFNYLQHKNLMFDFYIVPDHSINDTERVLIYYNNQAFKIKEISDIIDEIKGMIWESEMPFLTCNLTVHQDINLNVLHSLYSKLSESGVSTICYSGKSKQQYYARVYNNQQTHPFTIKHFIGKSILEYYNEMDKNNLLISMDKASRLKLNNNDILKVNLKNVIKESLINNPDYLILFKADNNLTFKIYFKTLMEVNDAIYEARNNYALERFSFFYNELDYVERKEVDEKYPFRIIQIFE